jgi:hypothetical protein
MFFSTIHLLLAIILSLLFGWLAAYFAQSRGRDPFLWFFLGMFFGIFSIVLLFFLPNLGPKKEGQEQDESDFFITNDNDLEMILPETRALYEDYGKREWYYLDKERKQKGPVSFNFLKTVWDEGGLEDTTYVWSNGMSNWERLNKVNKLKEALSYNKEEPDILEPM